MQDKLELILSARTALADGLIIPDSPAHVATEAYFAKKGDKLCLRNTEYVFAIGTYNFQRELKFKTEFCYLPESMWMTYNQDLQPTDYSNDEYVFEEDCYYKINFKRVDGNDMTEADIENIRKELIFTPEFRVDKVDEGEGIKACFLEEAEDTIAKCNELKEESCDAFTAIIVTDIHYVINGTWNDSEKNISYVCDRVKPDVIIHLGDLSDGIVSKKRTLRYAARVIDGLKENGILTYLTIGNHDANYYRNNQDVMTIEEQGQAYLERKVPYYYEDVDDIRMIFLFSYDNDNKVRYGFLDEEIVWLEKLLQETEKDKKVIVFSHDAPLARLDYWSSEIYNGDQLINILEKDNKDNENRVLAFIHGHTHADYIYRELSFPIVSVGCNKCEDFKEYTPEGFVKWDRAFDDVTQDLWDVLVYDKKSGKMDLVRFGAGEDRRVN